MTQEEKELLLKDLCGRLLYQPNLQIYYEDIAGSGVFDEELYEIDIDGQYCNDGRRLEDIKPYLRPMSSMTKEEKKKLSNIRPYFIDKNDNIIGVQCNSFIQNSECQDWLNSHHFDYRGLIPMGLALEAPENMYKD